MSAAQWIVTGTSMMIEADDAEQAIGRAQESSGWHWEARKAVYAPHATAVAQSWAQMLTEQASREPQEDDADPYVVEEQGPVVRYLMAGNGPATVWLIVVRDEEGDTQFAVVEAADLSGAGYAVLPQREAAMVKTRADSWPEVRP